MTELPSVSNDVQSSENARKNSFLNYETVALPSVFPFAGKAVSPNTFSTLGPAQLVLNFFDHIG
jgi:hypothetical protein